MGRRNVQLFESINTYLVLLRCILSNAHIVHTRSSTKPQEIISVRYGILLVSKLHCKNNVSQHEKTIIERESFVFVLQLNIERP
jgi:hypothetical protein